MKKVRVLIPSGALGLNYESDALERGLKQNPNVIVVDGGSTDSGPAYLGLGVSKYSRASTKLEWSGLMKAREKLKIPLIIGSAGTCGTDQTVNWIKEITLEIAKELGHKVKIAIVKSSQPKERIVQLYKQNRIHPLENAPEISEREIENCTNIVALAGAEQIISALKTGADIIISGRATDAGSIAAFPLIHGIDPGLAWHGGKIAECGALCATNPQSGVVMVEFDKKGFTIEPMSTRSFATPETVSAHMLYENSDPFILHEPGGYLDVKNSQYVAINNKSVRVTGSKWVNSDKYKVKLEGAKLTGYQTVLISLIRDERYIENIDFWVTDLQQKCYKIVKERLALETNEFSIEIRLIGKNATLGDLETKTNIPLEIGVLGIVTAKTENEAIEIGKILNPFLLHHPLTEQEDQPTFAFPFSPASINRGPIFSFCLQHVLECFDPMEFFLVETTTNA